MTERERRTRSGGKEDNVPQQAPLRVLCTRTLLCARCVHKKRTSGEDGENGGPAIGRLYRGKVRSLPLLAGREASAGLFGACSKTKAI
jgi:hypothetical protein